MKIYIANSKNEAFEEAKARLEISEVAYRGFIIRKHWNGFDFKGITLGYKFKTEEDAKKHADLMIVEIEKVMSLPEEKLMVWPETRK